MLNAGVIAAIFRLITTHYYLTSDDVTYTISSVSFWALAEITSVFLVYGMPSIPAAMNAAKTRIEMCYVGLTRRSYETRESSHASTLAPRQNTARDLGSRYRNIDKKNPGLDNSNRFDGKGSQRDSSGLARLDSPSIAVEVQYAIEVETHHRYPSANSNASRKDGDGIPHKQHF